MSIRRVVIRATARATAACAAMLPLLMAGCVSTSGDVQGARLTDNLQVYAPFDNERDWGPSYLIGAPSHHVGDANSPADPKGPPLTVSPADGSTPRAGAVPPAPPQQPLP
jgi:hypothetical protein